MTADVATASKCSWIVGGNSRMPFRLKQLQSDVITPITKIIEKRLVDSTNAVPNLPVYHYTTAESLKAIIETGIIRAGSMRYSNDTREYHHGFNAIYDGLVEAKNLTASAKLVVQKICNCLKSDSHPHKFACCFSELSDDLEQWRGYGAGGSGYAIGFNLREIVATSQQQQDDLALRFVWLLCKVIYDVDVVTSAIIKPLIVLLNAVELSDTDATIVAQHFADLLERYSPIFKHSAFAHEKEYRIFTDVEDCKELGFRIQNGVLNPFVELSRRDGKLPITDIVLGPCLRQDQARQSVQMLLRKYDYKSTTVTSSSVPYLP
jgi:hypothetical protein